LRLWLAELRPRQRKQKRSIAQFSEEQKQEAVIKLCTRDGSAKKVAKEVGASRYSLYNWKNELLGRDGGKSMTEKHEHTLQERKESLLSEIKELEAQTRRIKLEYDVLKAAAEIIKKGQGVDLVQLANKEKAMLIDALRSKHPLGALLGILGLSRSSYYYQCVIKCLEDKYEQLKARIIELFRENNSCYGYRRIHQLLKREGRRVSEKVVRALMIAANLIVTVTRRRKYSSYAGEATPAPENLLERDFHAGAPNHKWLTDITEFHIPAGKVYLSPVVDCFDGALVSWTMSTSPDADMVNSMLDMATSTLSEGEHPILHSDRGGHYRWPGFLERIERSGVIRSMSKKGCSPDNAACEGLFGRIKNEMFNNRSWSGVSIKQFMGALNDYLHWYNDKRIKMSLGGRSPLEYRRSLGLVS
jgi:putative transposase